MTFLDLLDMCVVVCDILCCQYFIKIAKVTMGDLRNKGDLSNEKMLHSSLIKGHHDSFVGSRIFPMFIIFKGPAGPSPSL